MTGMARRGSRRVRWAAGAVAALLAATLPAAAPALSDAEAATAPTTEAAGVPVYGEAVPAFGDGTPHAISWDKYSLKIDGQREYIWSGEFHPFRLPNPDL